MRASHSKAGIAFHWAVAAGILVLLPMGVAMSGMALSPEKLKVYSWHKWLGIAVLAVSGLRLAWMAVREPVAPPAGVPPAQMKAAQALHWALLSLTLAVPLSGWAMSSALGFPVVWFGVMPLPDWVPADKALGAALKAAHAGLSATLALAVAGHAGAALWHHAVKKDSTLRRMAPWLGAVKASGLKGD